MWVVCPPGQLSPSGEDLAALLVGPGVDRVRRPRPGPVRRERPDRSRFDAAMTIVLRAEDVLCGDETPTHVRRKTPTSTDSRYPGPRTRYRAHS